MAIFEKLAVENPEDREVLAMLGILIISHAVNNPNAEQMQKERARGRKLLVRAKELGADNTMMHTLLEDVPVDGSLKLTPLSDNSKIDQAMHEAEAAFANGDFAKALDAYQRVLVSDPKNYLAALFSGDVYRKQNKNDKAAEWFARAIAIDPNIETAHRYWGEMLMLNGELDIARDKLIEAYVLSPYYRLTSASLIMWADRKKLRLAHPDIDIPTSISSPEQGKTNITIDQSMLGGKDDGKSAWLMYGITRANWRNETFAKTFPKEKAYRHSLAEEVDALRLVLVSLGEQKKVKRLDPSLSTLKKLNDSGLLEAYILLGRADEGIAQDYAAYVESNRDKLRRYVVEYILTSGGGS